MEKLHCQEHGLPCLLKTGVRDGPNKGKSFYICAAKLDVPCGFTVPTNLPSSRCLQHSDALVELQALVKQPDREYKLYYRCTKGRAEGLKWCGRIPWQSQKQGELQKKEKSQPAPVNPHQPKPERNPFKILNENLPPALWKQVHEERQERKMVEEKQKSIERFLNEESAESWRQRELPVGMKVKKTYERKIIDPTEESAKLKKLPELKDGVQDEQGDASAARGETEAARQQAFDLTHKPSVEHGAGATEPCSPAEPESVGSNPVRSQYGAIANQQNGPSRQSNIDIECRGAAEPVLKDKKHSTGSESCPVLKTTEPKQGVYDGKAKCLTPDTQEQNAKNNGAQEPSDKADSKSLFPGKPEFSSESAKGGQTSAWQQYRRSTPGEAKATADVRTRADQPEHGEVDSKPVCNSATANTIRTATKKDASAARGPSQTDEDDDIVFVSSKPGKEKAASAAVIPPPGNLTVRISGSTGQRTISSFPGFGTVAPAGAPQNPAELHNQLKTQLKMKRATLATVNVQALPDKGQRLLKQVQDLEDALGALNLTTPESPEMGIDLKDVAPWKTTVAEPCNPFSRISSGFPSAVPLVKPLPFQDQRTGSLGLQGLSSAPGFGSNPQYSQSYGVNPQWQSLYGGRMTEDRLFAVRNVTSEAIDHLHKSLASCPSPESTVEDPDGLKVPLLLHQKQALAWLLWREVQKPQGGILADDMGLGKTLTMIALILAQKQKQKLKEKEKEAKKLEAWISKNESTIVPSRATLIICPASLIHHWKKEVEKRVSGNRLRVYLFHGPNRERDSQKLSEYDIVVTTYSLVSKEIPVTKEEGSDPAKDPDVEDKALLRSILLRITWARVILDEAHNIKNPKVQTSIAVCKLRAGTRWAVTGTPIQNNLLDMYSLLKFLRCSPFDEFKLWKSQVDNGSKKGGERLNILTKSLLLRRTKDQLDSTGKPLVTLPERRCEVHRLKLSEDEQSVYNVLFARSRLTLQSYLKRHEDRDQAPARKSDNPFDRVAQEFGASQQTPPSQQSPQASSTVHILSLLLRLRQCCCHLALLKTTLEQLELKNEGITLSLEEQLNALSLSELDSPDPKSMVSLNGSHFKADLFENTTESSKILCLLTKLKAIRSSPDSQKSVLVSQWTSMLKIVAVHLKRMGLSYATIDGSVNPKQRMDMVEEFNSNPKGPQVMLVSLCAGGVGLNLIGGNHLFLLDMHWNPALEDQACDRIYRVGQIRDVVIHRFVCEDTVEEKILDLQEKKKELAKKVLSGTGETFTKLTLADLKLLFGV